MLTDAEVSDALNRRFNCVVVGADSFEKGEVVIDSRGKGSLQFPDDYVDWKLAIE